MSLLVDTINRGFYNNILEAGDGFFLASSDLLGFNIDYIKSLSGFESLTFVKNITFVRIQYHRKLIDILKHIINLINMRFIIY